MKRAHTYIVSLFIYALTLCSISCGDDNLEEYCKAACYESLTRCNNKTKHTFTRCTDSCNLEYDESQAERVRNCLLDSTSCDTALDCWTQYWINY